MESIIAALIKTGSDVNATTATEEDTVLHLVIKHAVLRLAFQTCLMILEHKPDLDIRNRVRQQIICIICTIIYTLMYVSLPVINHIY